MRSTHATVGSSGEHRIRYDPCGNVTGSYGRPSVTDKQFTGQQQEPDSSLERYHYGAREYSPTTGQFMGADPLVAGSDVLTIDLSRNLNASGESSGKRQGLASDPNTGKPEPPSNPQLIDRYSYVTSNPLRYTDPTGLCFRLAGQMLDCSPRKVVELLACAWSAGTCREILYYQEGIELNDEEADTMNRFAMFGVDQEEFKTSFDEQLPLYDDEYLQYLAGGPPAGEPGSVVPIIKNMAWQYGITPDPNRTRPYLDNGRPVNNMECGATMVGTYAVCTAEDSPVPYTGLFCVAGVTTSLYDCTVGRLLP